MAIDIRKPLKKFAPHFIEARDTGLSEAETVKILIDFFEHVLGYDKFRDITLEAQLKNKYVDVCLKVDGIIRLLVEAKAASQKLHDRHIEQAEMYASRNYYPWVLLTNGVDWHLYHLTFDKGIEYKRAFIVSLSTDEALNEAAEKLALLHKRAIKKGELEKFWKKTTAIGPASIAKNLLNKDVLMRLRRLIRKDTGVLIDPEDLAESLHGMFSPEAREQIESVRIRKPSKPNRKVETTNAMEYRKFWEPIRTEPNGLFAGNPAGGTWITKSFRGIAISLVVHNHACCVDVGFYNEDKAKRRDNAAKLFPAAKYPHKLHDTPKCAYVRFPVLDKGIKDPKHWPDIREKLKLLGEDIYNTIKASDV